MAQDDKIVEADSPQPENSQIECPPSYTPRAAETPGKPIHPLPSSTPPALTEAIPELVHVPTALFFIDFAKIGPEPTNVICPRCHYGVRTSIRTRAGTHAG